MQKILVVDDDVNSRKTLENCFKDIYETIDAKDGLEAVQLLSSGTNVTAVFLDLDMPSVDGFAVLQYMQRTGSIYKIPVLIITALDDSKVLTTAFDMGAFDVIQKPFNISIIRKRTLNIIKLFYQSQNLSLLVEEKSIQTQNQFNMLIEAMADMVELRSKESSAHVSKIRGYTKILMTAITSTWDECKDLAPDIEDIAFAACLHDIGKNAIPDEILTKPGKLTKEEFNILKTHTIKGYEQVLSLKHVFNPSLYFYSLDIVRHHHERIDGSGYPDKLSGDKLSIWSQVVGLVDAYNALTTERSYQKTYDHEDAIRILLNGECGAFSPKLLDLFILHSEEINNFRKSISDEAPKTKKRVLIVDDSNTDREILSNILSSKYEVLSVSNAKDAFILIKDPRQVFNCVLIDIMMPEIDGFGTLNLLGKEFVKNIPTVLISSETEPEFILKASSMGVSAYIKKPYNKDLVLAKLESLLG